MRQMIAGMKQLDVSDPASDHLASYLYTADSRMAGLITELDDLMAEPRNDTMRKRAGEIMEMIAMLSFMALSGTSTIKSFQSAGPQIDLLVEGSDLHWKLVRKYCYFRKRRRGLVVEAKATGEKVNDAVFARLCAIMDHNLPHVGLGVFFTFNGASGFPTPESSRSLRTLKDCRLRQALYYARTRKPVIVFDSMDIRQLAQNGSLPQLVHEKVKEISEATGWATPPVASFCKRHTLPKHLRDLLI